MTKCAAKDCKNSSSKLVKMNYFPKDTCKRQEWIKHCRVLGGMDNWFPNKYAALCEFHFSKDMWEDLGEKKKLKKDAVPTIFGDLVCQVTMKVQMCKTKAIYDKECVSICDKDKNKNIDEPQMSIDIRQSLLCHQSSDVVNRIIIKPQVFIKSLDYCSIQSDENSEIILDTRKSEDTLNFDDNPSEVTCEVQSENVISIKKENDKIRTSDSEDIIAEEISISNMQEELAANSSNLNIYEKFQKLEKMYIKSENLRRLMKANHANKRKQLRNRIKQLETKVRTIESASKFSNIFDTQQVALLNKEYKKMPKWCDTSLVKAYQL